MALNNDQKKHFKQLGHTLKPVVIIGDNGLSETVVAELNRALEDHELIKVKLRTEDKKEIKTAVCTSCNAELVQAIGNIILIYRPAQKQNPKLSNLFKT